MFIHITQNNIEFVKILFRYDELIFFYVFWQLKD